MAHLFFVLVGVTEMLLRRRLKCSLTGPAVVTEPGDVVVLGAGDWLEVTCNVVDPFPSSTVTLIRRNNSVE